MAEEHTVDSLDAGTTLLEYISRLPASARARGADLHREGHVRQVVRASDRRVRGVVSDDMGFVSDLRREGFRWSSQCTCDVRIGCAHVVALALAWLSRGRAHGATPAPEQPPREPTFRQKWEPILAEKLGGPLSGDEGPFLGRLSNVFHNFKNTGRLFPTEIARLGFPTNEARAAGYRPAYEGWWEQPPRDPLELWQYIAYDIETSGLTVPEFMRPITDTRAIRERLKDRERREAIRRWRDRFAQLTAKAGRPDALALRAQPVSRPLDLRLRVGAGEWTLETRSNPEAPWKAAPRSFLDRFGREDSRALAQIEASPAVFAFLAICQEYRRSHYTLDLRPSDYGAPGLLHRFLSHRLARTLVVDGSGQPLRFSEAPVAWHLAPSANARDYELRLHLPDGSPLPPSAVHLSGEPDFYLHDGTIYPGPPALDGTSAAGAIVPAEAVEHPDALRTLHHFGTRLPPEMEARFVTVPLRARIECALEVEDFSGHEKLVLRLLALSDRPQVEQRWTIHGWQAPPRIDPADPTADPQKIYSFDLAIPDLAANRLPELKLDYDAYREHWTHRLTRSFPEEFLAWRESLPPVVEVLASGELASLLGAPVRARVDFDLIESPVHRDWFDLALALKPEDTTLTPEETALLLKARGKLVRLPGKGWRRLDVQIDETSSAALEAAGFDADTIAQAALGGERHRFHALQLAQTGVAELLPERQASALRARARDIAQPEPPAVPAGLGAELRPYQREGYHFLAFLSANQLAGVLADDMGLGKTVQTLAWLLWLSERQPAGEPLRVLVVCPKSVVGNWESETARFAPALQTSRFAPQAKHAPPAVRPSIVIANYTQLRLAADHFTSQSWHVVILDEGQFIKNPMSKVALVARDLPGTHRLILSGTPIENRLLDLWSLFGFALPGLLGSQASFKRHYAQDNPQALARLRSRVRHFLLRRTKAQVAADLPPRTEEELVVELEGEQAKLYQAELKRARAELLKVETSRQFDKARFNLLASLLRLRQICCHPALVDPAHHGMPSAKLDELLERVEALRDEGHQVLVFSQFVTMLELIRERLVAAGIGHLMLTGQTEDRDALVAQFQSEKQHTVFLLSLKAAGFGLNLTAASYVILYDPWWNPAVEAQAIDRTHRIGQSVPVIAYRLIARGTIEEKIRALQREKAALAGAIVQEESLAGVLDLESLRQILA